MMAKLLQRQFIQQNWALSMRTKMRGVAAVEFALVLIPMILLAVGAAEYGRALYQYNSLVKAVRDSARLLSQNNPADPDYPLTEAKCLVVYGVYGMKECTRTDYPPLAPGLTTDMVVVSNTNVSTGLNPIDLVEVKITGYSYNYVFNPAVFFTRDAPTAIRFSDIHTTMRQIL